MAEVWSVQFGLWDILAANFLENGYTKTFLLIVIFKKRIVYFNLLRQIKDEHCYIRGIRGEKPVK